MLEVKVEAADAKRRSSRMVSRQKGGQVLLTGYFIAANIGLIATNAWGLSPLMAILIVWLGGGVISICVAVAMASASFPDFTAIVSAYWRREFGADYQRP